MLPRGLVDVEQRRHFHLPLAVRLPEVLDGGFDRSEVLRAERFGVREAREGGRARERACRVCLVFSA